MEEKLLNVFRENDLHHEYDVYEDHIVVHANGDWKHTHARLDYLMGLAGFKCYDKVELDFDGDDFGSIDHYYRLTA